MFQKWLHTGIAPLFERVGQTAGDQGPFLTQIDAVVLLNKLYQLVEIFVGYGEIMKKIQETPLSFLLRLRQQIGAVKFQHGLAIGQRGTYRTPDAGAP